MSDSVRPHRRQPTRLCRPWDSPGKNAGVGCHFLLQYMKVKSESEVAQSCPTLSDPMDCSLPGSSVHGIFQARVLEWGAIAFSGNHAKMLKCFDPLHQIWFWLLSYFRSLTWSSSTLATWCKELPHSLRKTLMLGKIEGKRRRGRQRMRCLDGITNSVNMGLGGLWEIMKDRKLWHAAVMTWLSQTWLSNWKTTNLTC